MKKLFSKRSGFTLVEVLVAFVIFAIMAAMVMQIIRLAVAQRGSNQNFEQELNKDEELYVKSGMNTTYDAGNKTGELTFDFSGSSGPTMSIDYELRGSDGTNSPEGLNYVVGNVDYSASGNKAPGSVDPGSSSSSGSQSARNDTRITGTKGIDKIDIYNIFEDTSFSGEAGQHRYIFLMSADASGMASEDVRYAQIKLYLYSTDVDDVASKLEYTDSNGKKYTKTVYKKANVLEVGYVSGSTTSYDPANLTSSRVGAYNVEKLTGNGIRIGTPFSGSGTQFETSKNIYFYVVTDAAISTSTASFGSNAKSVGTNTSEYTAYPVYDDAGNETGDTSVNIYGAYQYKKTYK